MVCLIVSGVDELGSRYNTHVAAVVAIGVFVVSTPLAVRFTVATMTTGATGFRNAAYVRVYIVGCVSTLYIPV